MKKDSLYIIIIGYALAVLYGIFVMNSFFSIQAQGMIANNIIKFLIFCGLLITSVGVINLKEWGRKYFVLINTGVFLLLIIKITPKIGIVNFSYFMTTLIMMLYFGQDKIKAQFYGKKIQKWKSVLLIDDDIAIQKVLRPVLMSQGYSVLTANSGETGLQIAKTQKPDLIILDVILPGIKGREVCKELKSTKETENIPVVFLTAKDSPDDIQAEMEIGAETHMTKPVNPKLLLSTIKHILKDKVKK